MSRLTPRPASCRFPPSRRAGPNVFRGRRSGRGPARWCVGATWCKKLRAANRVSYRHTRWRRPYDPGSRIPGWGMSAGEGRGAASVLPMPWGILRNGFARFSRQNSHEMDAPATVNREQLRQLALAVFDGPGGGKGPNHIRHPPALAKNCVRRDAGPDTR
jgi:hypothetical protein